MQIRSPREIGLVVRDRRKQLGLTQLQLARRVGTSRLWLLQLEQGKATAQLGLVLQTLRALEVQVHLGPPAPPVATARRNRPRIDLDAIIANSARPLRR